jgi:DNA-directed RNA polymerase specialized sigma24 family protein
VRTLDHRLYAWLAESDERQFERAFSAYFSVAFPALVRYLARLSRWDPAQLEELAQDALLKFFDRVGRRRGEASREISSALPRIRPLKLGVFHERQVRAWTEDVSSFRKESISFRLGAIDQVDAAAWKAEIRTLANRIPMLQGRGCRLLDAVAIELRWTFEGGGLIEETATVPSEARVANAADGTTEGDPASHDLRRDIAECLAREVRAATARALAAEASQPGVMQFIDASFGVVEAIPLLRVPTNGYLFEIAMTLYLDECKKRGRQKRGGTLVLEKTSGSSAEQDSSQHPVELVTLDSLADGDTEDPIEEARSGRAIHDSLSEVPAGSDPTEQFEDQEFLERFHQYLRAPVDAAAEAYHKAQAHGRAAAERHKLESVSRKFERTIAVLSSMGEGYTQEQTAERLGLTRNQVKYIIELVQEAYQRFSATSIGSSSPSASLGEPTHVR